MINKENEIWKPVPTFEGKFFASNLGRIKSKTGIIQRQFKPRTLKYWFVVIKEPKKKERQYISHRLIAEAFIPNPENKETVNHKDGNPSNNAPENLEWATHKENIHHAIELGLIDNKGENHPNSILTNSLVYEIRKLYSMGKKLNRIAIEFGLNYATTLNAACGKTWKHLPTVNKGRFIQLSLFKE